MATLQFHVLIRDPLAPERDAFHEWSSAQIRQHMPQLAALFPEGGDDAFPAVEFTNYASLYHVEIEPLTAQYMRDVKAEAEHYRRELERQEANQDRIAVRVGAA